MSSVLAATTALLGVWLAVDPAPEESDVRPGWTYGAIIIGLVLVMVLLWFSLRKQLGRIDVTRADRDAGRGADRDDRGDDRPAGR